MTTTEFSTPEALLARLDAQGWMPLVRIGEALTSLGMITDEQLRAGLAEQQRDRSVPPGETLVRMGAMTRADLKPRSHTRWAIRWSTSTTFRTPPKRCKGSATARRSACGSCR